MQKQGKALADAQNQLTHLSNGIFKTELPTFRTQIKSLGLESLRPKKTRDTSNQFGLYV